MAGREYDFWLLDLDGTLVDVESQYIYDVFDEIGGHFGTSFSQREAEQLWYGFGGTRSDVFEAHDIDREAFWDVFHDVDDPEPRAGATHIYDDAARFVPTLDGPVGLVTHCQEYLTRPVLAELGIADWFDTVVCCTDETGWKPDPRPVELAMSELGVAGNGHSGVLVGDDPQDVGAARNAGIESVHVTRHDLEWFDAPIPSDRTVPSLTALE